jgi:hypothetical protein
MHERMLAADRAYPNQPLLQTPQVARSRLNSRAERTATRGHLAGGVNGQSLGIPVGCPGFSGLAAASFPGWWPRVLPAGG